MGCQKPYRVLGVTLVAGAMLLGTSGTGLTRGSLVYAAQRQQQQRRQPQPMPPTDMSPLDNPTIAPDGGIGARMDAERVKGVNDDRHKRLAADVDKLVSLTNELKADLDKTSKDELSVDVIRKAGEIEKLAHDVQSRMKN